MRSLFIELLFLCVVIIGCSRGANSPESTHAASEPAPIEAEAGQTGNEQDPQNEETSDAPLPDTQGAAPQQETVEANCPPLKVVVEGQEVTLGHGLAYRTSKSVEIEISDQQVATCEDMLKGYRNLGANEQYAAARISKRWGGIVSFKNHSTQAELEEIQFPEKVGDEAVICAPEEVKLKRGVGYPEVTIVGRFTGQYCGERE